MLPEKFCERMKNTLGDEYESFLEGFGNDDERYHALRINRLKAKEGFENNIEGLLEAVPWEKNGFYYDKDAAPGKSPYHEAGLYYIQEPSAMAPVHFLDPKPGEKILDLCAAPGGKSTQIAVAMKGEGILVTNEINRDRAKILSLNIERLGIRNALVLNETPLHLSEIFEGYFDRILVDAPCSGEGMFRKNEEAFSEWSPENVELCAQRQSQILDCASKMLKPGGVIAYSTCTFSVDENEETIYNFLLGHSDFHVLPVSLIDGMLGAVPEWIRDNGVSSENAMALKEEVRLAIRLWPHKLKGEGHFLCVLKRDGESGDSSKYVPGGRTTPAPKEIQKLFWDFAKESLEFADFSDKKLLSGIRLDGTLFMFGDQLYISDPLMPSIKGLKVLRPGLHLGTVKKDRFEPSHALALAIAKEDAVSTVDYSSDSSEIRQFLNGQTLRINVELKKGWTLITCNGYSIGWAKAAGGMLKNHYPKGLRINY
jgi:NOL1/NOP2/sun family putative RNA methylase